MKIRVSIQVWLSFILILGSVTWVAAFHTRHNYRIGLPGRTDQKAVLRNVKGVMDVMKLFKMIEGTPQFTENPEWIDHYEVVRSDHHGLFYPQTKMGYYATKGEKIGYVTDYFGEVVQEFYAPFSGMILYIVNTPPANKGEPVYEIGRVKEK